MSLRLWEWKSWEQLRQPIGSSFGKHKSRRPQATWTPRSLAPTLQGTAHHCPWEAAAAGGTMHPFPGPASLSRSCTCRAPPQRGCVRVTGRRVQCYFQNRPLGPYLSVLPSDFFSDSADGAHSLGCIPRGSTKPASGAGPALNPGWTGRPHCETGRRREFKGSPAVQQGPGAPSQVLSSFPDVPAHGSLELLGKSHTI